MPEIVPLPPTNRDRRSGRSTFALQFPIEDVPKYAALYDDDDSQVLGIGRAARQRGSYTRDEFITVCYWKTPRTQSLVQQNTSEAIEVATRIALDPSSSERARIEALLQLNGIGWPSASVFLHLAYPERYPILDWRALEALGVAPSTYGFPFWESYVAAYLGLVKEAGVDGRTLDRALWQWSRERSAGARPSRHRTALATPELVTNPSESSRRQRWSELGVGERRAAALEALEAALAVRGFTVTRVKGRSMIVNARRGGTAIEIHLQSSMNRGPAYWRKSLLTPAAGRYAALALLEGRDPPKLYLIPSLDWRVSDGVLVNRTYEDDASDPEWGINLPGVRADLERYAFDRGISRV